jgi:hypothetical protein
MKKNLGILALTALGSLAFAAPVLAQGDDTPTDYQVAVKAA